jgi:beta-glucosidase
MQKTGKTAFQNGDTSAIVKLYRNIQPPAFRPHITFAGVVMNFPKNFLWGCATSSYQIEGAAEEDGKTPSIWDTFTHEKNRIRDNRNGDTACDHYHRYKEDLQIMAEMGIKAYRFSISWPRVMSYDADAQQVNGSENRKGMDFYDRLIDGLLEKNIEPWITLYHWDLPLEIERRGGFRNRDCRYWMADYASRIAKRFGDRVQHFITINEAPCIIGTGYMEGRFAPGLTLSVKEGLNAAHNLLLAHGSMVQALRAAAPQKIQVGFVHCGAAHYPASESEEDIAAYRRAQSAVEVKPGVPDMSSLTYWLDPVYKGTYPRAAWESFPDDMPVIRNGDMELISTPTDFHGHNVYNGSPIAADTTKPDGWRIVPFSAGYSKTAAGWPVTPESLKWLPQFLSERYKKPVYITENGMSGTDRIFLDGKVHDPQRIDFTSRYLQNLAAAIKAGADVRGYFHWSLLDNFEWASGYTERFGLVYVDYETGRRIPKDSAEWYAAVIRSNGSAL